MSYKSFSAAQDASDKDSPDDKSKPAPAAGQPAIQPGDAPAKSAPEPNAPAADQPHAQPDEKPAEVAPAPKS